jgi:uncharacterized membrane protein YhaH (DUF805 family)
MSDPSAARPLPGWYPDPTIPGQVRYWDGAAWTMHVQAAPPAWPAPVWPTPSVPVITWSEATRRGFTRWRDYSSRATRAEYWWFYLTTGLISLVLTLPGFIWLMIVTATESAAINRGVGPSAQWWMAYAVSIGLAIVVSLALLPFSLSVSVRRLHDIDRSGWWMLMMLAACVGGTIVLLIFWLLPGTAGPNRYGHPSVAS